MKLRIFLVSLNLSFCVSAFCMQDIIEQSLNLAVATFSVAINQDMINEQKLLKKDFNSIDKLDFLSETNYCAGAIVDIYAKPTYIIANEPSLNKSIHSIKFKQGEDQISVFLSGGSDKKIEPYLKAQFAEYHLKVFGTPFPSIYPEREVHFRKSDSEQKLLYALRQYKKDTPNIELMYYGGIIVIYSVRNTCQFCNVSLGGFIAEQIINISKKQPSIFIKGIHVFYSYDDGKLVKKEHERIDISPYLVQPYMTYTQLTQMQTVKCMIDGININKITEKYNTELFDKLVCGISKNDCIDFLRWFLCKDKLFEFFKSQIILNTIINFIKTNKITLSKEVIDSLLDKLLLEDIMKINDSPYIKILLTTPDESNSHISAHKICKDKDKKIKLKKILNNRVD